MYISENRVLLSQFMDVLHLEEIPVKHIVKRWTKDVKNILP